MGKRVAGVSSFAFVVGMLLLVGAQPAVAAGGGLGPVKVKPRSVTVKPGGVAKVQAVTRVRRDLKRVRICARGPKSALRLPPRPCTNFGTLRRGEGAVVKFRVRIRPRARAGKTYRLRFRATARGAQSRVGVARIRVKAKAGARTALTVCKHGCRYRTIQSAVDAVGKRNFKPRAARTTIRIKPGRYVEGVRMVGHRYDGLTLRGVGKSPRAGIVEGRNAKDPDGNPANNGIEARNVNRVRILNLWARNFGTNGVFLIEVERGPRNAYRFSFQDLVLLRAARGLIQARVPHLRVLRALRRLKAQLPPDRNLSELRILVDGDDVIVSDGSAAWNPASGQLHLDFQVAELSESIAPLHASVRPAAPAVTADDWFERGVELELVSAEDAVTAYENALELNPRHADAHVNLGRLLHEARRLAQAELHYRAALAPGPHATAAYNLGIVLEDRQRQKEAVSAYLRALDADPHMADAHYNLSRLYEQLGDEASALRHLTSYRSLTQGTGRA